MRCLRLPLGLYHARLKALLRLTLDVHDSILNVIFREAAMKIIDLYKRKKTVISFEVFPPKPDVPISDIYVSLDKFALLKPDFISVTYGAGGSVRQRTVEISSRIKNTLGIESLVHLTCIGHSFAEIDEMLKKIRENRLENIMALRGDPPLDTAVEARKGDFKYAGDLISYIRRSGLASDFSIAAAAYVEAHPESPTIKQDLMNLKLKVEAGVDFLTTQLFFDNRRYLDFAERAACMGITCPIVPGIMPIFKADRIKTMTAKSGCSIPASLVLMMDKYGSNDDDMRKAGIEYAAGQIRELLDNGAPGIHLYTMVRPVSTKEILIQAGLM